MKPGAYLRLRREAAGLTIEQAAELAVRSHSDHADLYAKLIGALERGEQISCLEHNPYDLVFDLQRAFAFSYLVWEELDLLQLDPEADLPVPQVCIGCGCSWSDPCNPGTGKECAWRDPGETGGATICTSCPVPQAVSPHSSGHFPASAPLPVGRTPGPVA